MKALRFSIVTLAVLNFSQAEQVVDTFFGKAKKGNYLMSEGIAADFSPTHKDLHPLLSAQLKDFRPAL